MKEKDKEKVVKDIVEYMEGFDKRLTMIESAFFRLEKYLFDDDEDEDEYEDELILKQLPNRRLDLPEFQ